MLYFNQYLTEAEGPGLTMFDIDDTLFQTDNKVYVKKDGKIVAKLTPAEYNMYKLKQGEDYDYKEFRTAALFNKQARPIRPMLAKLKAISKNVHSKPGSKLIMLTARKNMDDKKTFLDTFKKFGIDIDKIYIERAGNIRARTDIAKKIITNDYLKKGKFNRVRLYDDHMQNLKSFLELQTKFPDVVFEAYLVKNGRVTTIKEAVKELVDA